MKTQTKNRIVKRSLLSKLRTPRGIIVALLLVSFAAYGAYRVFFASAAPNNCQPLENVQVCDVDQVISKDGLDAFLSVDQLARDSALVGWGTYYGTAFRVPNGPYKGAEPIYRTNKADWTLHSVKFGGADLNAALAAGATNEGLLGYAWRNNPNIPGVVPVYRVTGTGWKFVDVFTSWTDVYNNLRSQTDVWKDQGIAFWAFAMDYAPPNQVNPFDCSKQENFYSDRCAGARQELTNKITQDAKTNNPTSPPASAASQPASSPGTASQPASSPGTAAQPGDRCADPNPDEATTFYCQGKLVALAQLQGKQVAETINCSTADGNDPKVKAYCTAKLETTAAFTLFVKELERQKQKAAEITAFKNAVTANNNDKAQRTTLDVLTQQRRWNQAVEANCSANNQITVYATKNGLDWAQGCGRSISNPQKAYRCTLTGEQDTGLYRDRQTWVSVRFTADIRAVGQFDADNQCAQRRTALNKQDKYRSFTSKANPI